MAGFVGRARELKLLSDLVTGVASGSRTGRPGKALLIRGRRRVGKSRLVEEFIERSGLPSVYFTAVGGSRSQDLAGFTAAIAESDLPHAELVADFGTPQTWDAALGVLGQTLPTDTPSVVILDELPYLVREDVTFEGSLQKAFDRTLSRLPVLLILIGSDIGMMQELNTYGRPFYQRGTDLVVPSLNPAEVGEMLGLRAADAFDAFLVTGGLPLILEEWPEGANLWIYLAAALGRPTSPLLVSGERVLAAEFPTEALAQQVLAAIGNGERTFTLIAREAGGMSPATLTRALDVLVSRQMVTSELPLSTQASKLTRYRISDPYLRFWLAFVRAGIPTIERGRGDLVLQGIRSRWTDWRGRAIEPVVRDGLWRLADDQLPDGSDVVGSYWTRNNDPEIDIVAADRSPVAKRITAVGSIKWHDRAAFDVRDLARLAQHRDRLPGASADTALIAISRTGSSVDGLKTLRPDELISAWPL
ncbi:ATP-binding protein [Cryptosporangium phraense]|uniref:ATP-binding protein n=1 Tax=Cryptosporangium phraense TaxID=2593070 RepID=A0A545AYY1_9ACTN|nr:ATP-binding protein [Cryptosporangium phraense]TQS46504.1 ATP-binding protein [Cryptosporangium phraense]